MAPPVTPSPHRFVTPTAKRQDAPQSSLRIRRQALESSSSQFAPTPRFSLASRKNLTPKPPKPIPSSPLIRHPPTQRPTREDIESGSDHEDVQEEPALDYDSEDEMLLDAYDHPPRKRRRLSPSPPPRAAPIQYTTDPVTVSSSPLASPLPPASPPIPSPHRAPLRVPTFLPGRLPPSSPPHTSTRPAFLLPAPDEVPPPPLPVFSPTRRSQKYIPSGLASTALSFIVSAAQARPPREGWDIRFRIGEVGGDEGMRLVKDEKGRGWLLLGKGDVRRGGWVGIRRPVWDVGVAGESWAVGVEWVSLDAR